MPNNQEDTKQMERDIFRSQIQRELNWGGTREQTLVIDNLISVMYNLQDRVEALEQKLEHINNSQSNTPEIQQ